jgi:hypothetical protein
MPHAPKPTEETIGPRAPSFLYLTLYIFNDIKYNMCITKLKSYYLNLRISGYLQEVNNLMK